MISYIEILLIIFLIVLAVALAVAVYRPKEENVPPIVISNSNKPGKRKNQRVKPYRKWEKKMNQKKGKNAMLKAEYVFLPISEANSLMIYDNSREEMKLLDLILDAKLSGTDFIKLDRTTYEILKSRI